MQNHIVVDPESAVRKWSTAVCSDYQLPLAGVVGFVFNAILEGGSFQLRQGETSQHKAMSDLILNSHLRQLVTAKEGRIEIRRDIDPALKEAIIDLWSKSPNILPNY